MLDEIDKEILRKLQDDSKITIKELSAELHLSPTPIFERIKKLEKESFILGYKSKLNRRKLGLSLMVICNISLNTHQKDFLEKFENDIKNFVEVKDCFHIAGMYDYLLTVLVKDMDAYQYFVSKKLASLDNIGKVQSSFVMTEVKSDDGYRVE